MAVFMDFCTTLPSTMLPPQPGRYLPWRQRQWHPGLLLPVHLAHCPSPQKVETPERMSHSNSTVSESWEARLGEGKYWSSQVICTASSPRIPPSQLLVTTASAVYFGSENTYYDKLSGRLWGNKRKQNKALSTRQLYSTQWEKESTQK